MSDHADSVICPECGTETGMGLPQSASVRAVRSEPAAELDETFVGGEPRHKRRRNACENEHTFYVYFSF